MNSELLMSNVHYLSGLISYTDYFDSMLSQDKINELVKTIEKRPKELEEPIQKCVMALKLYHALTEQAVEGAILKLIDMNDFVESDLINANYVASKKDQINNEQLVKGCAIVDIAEAYLKDYNATVEECKNGFRKAIVPQLEKINRAIDDLISNEDNTNVEMKIKELSVLIISEIQTIKEKAEQALTELDECIANKGTECEAFMKGIHAEFQTLLG